MATPFPHNPKKTHLSKIIKHKSAYCILLISSSLSHTRPYTLLEELHYTNQGYLKTNTCKSSPTDCHSLTPCVQNVALACFDGVRTHTTLSTALGLALAPTCFCVSSIVVDRRRCDSCVGRRLQSNCRTPAAVPPT